MGFQYIHWSVPCGTGVKGSGPPLPENHKNIEYLSNTGPDPLKFSKLPSQHSMLGHHLHPSETPFKWRFAGGPMMARFCDIWILSPLKKEKKKTLSELQSWTPSDKTFWIRVWVLIGSSCNLTQTLCFEILRKAPCSLFLSLSLSLSLSLYFYDLLSKFVNLLD